MLYSAFTVSKEVWKGWKHAEPKEKRLNRDEAKEAKGQNL